MNEYYLRAAGDLTICFRIAHDLGNDAEALLQFGAYVPGFQLLDAPSEQANLTLEHVFGQENVFENQGDKLILTSNTENGVPIDAYHLLYGAVRKHLLEEKGLCTVHAACVGKGDEFRLIAGHSGSGKTTLSQKLIESQGQTLFSGNKTVIRFNENGKITALGGTRTMTALDKNLKRYAYELPPESYAVAKEVPITGIEIIRVNDGVEECETLSPLSAAHSLYPYFMDQVNADVIVGGTHIFDGSVSLRAKQNITRDITNVLENIPVRKVSGSMNYMEGMMIR